TADLAVEALSLKPDEVVGVDISEGMLRLAAQKLAKRGLMDRIRLVQADAAALPFDVGSFDGALVGFGVRNLEDLRAGLAGVRRVLRPSAPLVVLEFGHPPAVPVRQASEAYARHVLRRVGRAVSGSDAAYTSLPESVAAFPDGADCLRELEAVGFREAEAKPLTFGIVSLYRGRA